MRAPFAARSSRWASRRARVYSFFALITQLVAVFL
jgi:hypothetical protein